MTSTKDEIISLFEKHRKDPSALYEADHFLDFLMVEPKYKGIVRNRFSGLKRFNAFIDEVQLHYGVCFSNKDIESNYSLERFVERVEELRKSKRSSLASLRNQKKHGLEWNMVIIANAFICAFGIFLREYILAQVIALFLFIFVNIYFFQFYYKERRYFQKLEEKVNGL